MENQNVINESNTMQATVSKVLYTGKVHTSGGREGTSKSNDGRLIIDLTSPGTAGTGTNPEQLFAAGWSACFIGAMKLNASASKISLPAETSVDAEIDLANGVDGYSLQARLTVNLPGLEYEQAKAVVEAAHQTCPYSKVTRGNINIQINVTV